MRSLVRVRMCVMYVGIICVSWFSSIPAMADEVPKVWFVKADAVGFNDGSNWQDAFANLQDALAAAEAGDEIWVAAGTYTPGGPGDRIVSFELKSRVEIYGGFVGTEVNRNERNPAINITILSGDLNGNDIEVLEPSELANEPTRSDNSYHVVIGSGADETAVLDGFVITGGNANGSGNYHGGGMINISRAGGSVPANPTLANCTFHRNSASRRGGGIYSETGTLMLIDIVFSENHSNGATIQLGGGGMYNERGNLTLRNCRFVGNTTTGNGAGLYNNNATPVITDTAFEGNMVVRFGHQNNGGGILNNRSDPTITNCTFTGNSASFGGGIWNWGPPSPVIFNCIFSRNEAINPNDGAGGGIQNWGGNPTVINCTFNKNTAEGVGGGIGEANGSRTIVRNCILWDNHARDRSDANGQIGSSSTVVTYSCVQSGRSGEGNIDVNPHFADPSNGDFHLKSQAGRWDPIRGNWTQDDLTSPCIDAGDPMSPIGLEPFPSGGFVNMGAYGATATASKTYFGKQVAETIVAGDINGDGEVDHLDLEIMALHWTGNQPLELQ